MLGALAVALGAFGAHGLKTRLAPEMLAVWSTAVQYHFWHALGVLAVGLAAIHFDGGLLRTAGWLLVGGTAVFCGSLYALALGAPKAMGAVAPFGGLALVAGWLVFAAAVISARTPG